MAFDEVEVGEGEGKGVEGVCGAAEGEVLEGWRNERR